MKQKRASVRVLIIAISLFSITPSLWSEVPLNDVIDTIGIRFFWDPYREVGILKRGGDAISFKLGSQWILYGYGERVGIGSLYRGDGGQIYLSSQTAKSIVSYFRGEPERRDSSQQYKIAGILIDAGHGGRDTGAIKSYTVDGKKVLLQEKHINLNVALYLAELLADEYPDKEIKLVRDSDKYISLEERVEIANQWNLDPYEGTIFISIHANAAALNDKARGFEIWYIPESYRQNIATPETYRTGHAGATSLLQLAWEAELFNESKTLAQFLLDRFDESVGHIMPNRGLKQEAWFVVRKANMASVLIELGFITNPEEAAVLRNPNYLDKMTHSIYNGIIDFVDHFEN